MDQKPKVDDNSVNEPCQREATTQRGRGRGNLHFITVGVKNPNLSNFQTIWPLPVFRPLCGPKCPKNGRVGQTVLYIFFQKRSRPVLEFSFGMFIHTTYGQNSVHFLDKSSFWRSGFQTSTIEQGKDLIPHHFNIQRLSEIWTLEIQRAPTSGQTTYQIFRQLLVSKNWAHFNAIMLLKS